MILNSKTIVASSLLGYKMGKVNKTSFLKIKIEIMGQMEQLRVAFKFILNLNSKKKLHIIQVSSIQVVDHQQLAILEVVKFLWELICLICSEEFVEKPVLLIWISGRKGKRRQRRLLILCDESYQRKYGRDLFVLCSKYFY